MKNLVALDIETTSIDPEEGLILSLGMIDTIGKKVHILFKHSKIYGNPYALNMNKEIIEDMVKERYDRYTNVFEWDESVTRKVAHQIEGTFGLKKFNLCGKNLKSFDLKWIENKFSNPLFLYNRRILDPAILYTHKEDKELPNLETCKARSGIFTDTTVKHDALEDCKDILDLLKHKGIG